MALGGAYMTATGEQADTGETIVGQGGRLAAMDVVLQQANGQQEKTWVVPMIEARRGQAFAAVYEASPAGWRCVVPDGIRLMAAWMDDLRGQAKADKPVRIIFTGEVGLHRETIQAMANLWSGSVHTTEHGLRARFVAELGRMRWKRGDLEHVHALVPNYTQLAEARRNFSPKGPKGGFAKMNEFHHSAEADHDTVRFRAMTEADIPAICEIEQESFTTPWTEGAFHNELTNNQFAKYTVLEFDGEVAGYGGMWLIMEEAHVTNIAIRQKYRGQKLGERLLTEMQQTASLFGVQRMTLEVRPSNEIARRLYEKKGFRSVGVRRGYYTDNQEDAIIMWADLPKISRKA